MNSERHSPLVERHPVEYPDSSIQGLCGKPDCSCDACRNARKNDPGRQEWLLAKWRFEAKIEDRRTLENTMEHDRINSFRMKKGA